MTDREREARIREIMEREVADDVSVPGGSARITQEAAVEAEKASKEAAERIFGEINCLRARAERYRGALEEVEAKPEEAIQKIRDNGFVFETDLSRDDLTETERWEKLAFTLYTILVSAGESAHRALNDGEDDA